MSTKEYKYIERKSGEFVQDGDDTTLNQTIDSQAPFMGCLGAIGVDCTKGWVITRFGEPYGEQYICGKNGVRARYLDKTQ